MSEQIDEREDWVPDWPVSDKRWLYWLLLQQTIPTNIERKTNEQ